MDPEHYVERIHLASGQVVGGIIRPEELLVRSHRDRHPVEIAARALLGLVSETSGQTTGVRVVDHILRNLAYRASNLVARGLGTPQDDSVARQLFGLPHRPYGFRFKARPPARFKRQELREAASQQLKQQTDGLRVLLTGGTGFIGKEILTQAARDPAVAETVVLVRPRSVLDGGERRQQSTQERGRLLCAELGLEESPKLRFVEGDVEQPELGLTPELRAELGARITHIVHCAANVAFDSEYQDAFRANVLGNRQTLELALRWQQSGGSFVAHLAIETCYIHGRGEAAEDALVFPRHYFNNYYELTKAIAALETEAFMLEHGLRVVQLCPSIVVGRGRCGCNRGDLKVVNAPVNLFGRAADALHDPARGWGEKALGWFVGQFATVFPGDPLAEINLIPVDWVAAGVLAGLVHPEAIGERIHLATDRRITALRMQEILAEELEIDVKLAEPAFHRLVRRPILGWMLRKMQQGSLARALDKLSEVFGNYSEWNQPRHQVGNDERLLGLPSDRPDGEQVFRMVCRHNKYVQQFGRIRSPQAIASREHTWRRLLAAIEKDLQCPAVEVPSAAFRHEVEVRLDQERFALRGSAGGGLEPTPHREPFALADAAWLHMDDPSNLMQITGVFILDRRLEVDALKEVFRTGLLGYPRFRMRAVDTGLGLPHWELDPDFELDSHLSCSQIEPGTEALQKRVGVLMALPLDRRRPLWHWHLLQRPEGSVLVSRLHHAIGDGIALMRVLLQMTHALPGEAEQAFPPRLPVAAPPAKGQKAPLSLRLLHEGRAIALQPGKLLDLAGASLGVAGELGHLLVLPADPVTPLKGRLGVPKLAAWSEPIPLATIKRVKVAVQGTVNDVLMAALAGALAGYLRRRGAPLPADIRAVVPVDLRRRSDPELGNRFGLVFLALPLVVGDPLERLAELKRRMDRLKRSPEAVVAFGMLTAMGGVPASVESRVIDLFGSKATAVVTNVPGPSQVRCLAGAPIREMVFWVPQAGRLGLGLSILSYAGQVTLGVASDAGLIPDPEILAEEFNTAFAELAEAAA